MSLATSIGESVWWIFVAVLVALVVTFTIEITAEGIRRIVREELDRKPIEASPKLESEGK